jgi:aryl-alcohol dehydrogenase-like predicted oxidoreductase
MGYLTDRPWPDLLRERGGKADSPELQRAQQVRDWATAQGISILHLAIQYVLREKRLSTVLVGAARIGEVEQNVKAATTPLPEQLWQQLEADLGIA